MLGFRPGSAADWFFAPLVARRLSKPILYIYKDLQMLLWAGGKAQVVEDLGAGRSVHYRRFGHRGV